MRLALAALLLIAGGAPVVPVVGLALAVTVGGFAVDAVRQSRRRARAQSQTAVSPGSIPLGVSATGSPVALSREALGAHAVILGASGSGKSTTMLSILSRQISEGMPVVAVDLKGSPGFARELEAAAAAAGRELRVWSLDGGAHWNPLAAGNATELKDKLIATERFSEPHYQRAAERYVQLAIGALQTLHPQRAISLSEVVDALEPKRLRELAARLDPEREQRLKDYLGSLGRDQLSAVCGLGSRLAVIAESSTGPYLEAGDVATIDLRDVLAPSHGGAPPPVVLFSLNSSSYGRLAGQIGTLVVQDVIAATGARLASGEPPVPATVAIDEFSALQSDNVVSLLARGREAGIGVILATQELADLERAGRGVADQILGNAAVRVIHRQDNPASARAAAEMVGTHRVWEQSHSRDDPPGVLDALVAGGRSPRASGTRTHHREVERLIVEPRQIMNQPTGRALVIQKTPAASAELTAIAPAPRGRDQHGGPSPESPDPGRRGRRGVGRQPPAPGVTR